MEIGHLEGRFVRRQLRLQDRIVKRRLHVSGIRVQLGQADCLVGGTAQLRRGEVDIGHLIVLVCADEIARWERRVYAELLGLVKIGTRRAVRIDNVFRENVLYRLFFLWTIASEVVSEST